MTVMPAIPSKENNPESGRPRTRDWVIFAVTFIPVAMLFYGALCYVAVSEKAQVEKQEPVAVLLASLQHGRLPEPTPATVDAAREQLGIDGDNANDYMTRFGPDSGAPEIVVCRSSCAVPASRVTMRLAYGHQEELDNALDYWDFWFSPIVKGKWVRDRLRFLYRVNPGQGTHWGLVLGDVTDSDVSFGDNKIAGLPNIGDTGISDFMQNVVEEQRVEEANFIGAPASALTSHGEFRERGHPPRQLPYSNEAARMVRDAGSGIRTFVVGAASEANRLFWIALFIGFIGSLSMISTAVFVTCRAWGAVIVFLATSVLAWIKETEP